MYKFVVTPPPLAVFVFLTNRSGRLERLRHVYITRLTRNLIIVLFQSRNVEMVVNTLVRYGARRWRVLRMPVGSNYTICNVHKIEQKIERVIIRYKWHVYSVGVVFEATRCIIKLYHHRQHKKYTVRDSIKEVVSRKEIIE